ncbi:hypothetical protein L484_014139 [Morus notabilis]|uniref:RING-type domain-containing protein n=1 Tax=Morus notabilis TaxID=981085 RepID=W9RJS4_9ROSA|nr:uncharacterized protein LOC21397289 isoform X1 [Morus notabilis]XP_024023209.1 uncharacterized protein LOC21397289 isoform X1 [Morus notabilis]EXB77013.1 hypothetical protein L484_014139 [Morus notabilis]
MSQLGVILQESVRREREARTILCFLREQMDVADEERGRKRSLKERLGLTGMGCCGATWGFRPTTISVLDDDEIEEQQQQEEHHLDPTANNPGPICSDPDPPGPSMNLAAALAAERQLRTSNDNERGNTGDETTGSRTRGSTAPGTPMRVSLMRLLEETDGRDAMTERSGAGGGVGSCDSVCCVCMGRKKGAAFIPCGHTFCRVCSRELWLNRGACPLCNRPILEILDIF